MAQPAAERSSTFGAGGPHGSMFTYGMGEETLP